MAERVRVLSSGQGSKCDQLARLLLGGQKQERSPTKQHTDVQAGLKGSQSLLMSA